MLAFPESDVVERLQGLVQLKGIGLAPDLAEAIRTPPKSAPWLFVAFATRGGASELSGAQVQGTRTTEILLVPWIRNHGTPSQVLAERRALVEAIDARLVGWVPDAAVDELYLASARDEFAHGAWLVSRMSYQARWTYTGTRQA
jgi:hypothetical protein